MLCLVASAYAQQEDNINKGMQFRWGFKGGLNFTTYSSECDDIQAHMGQWGVLCRWTWGSFAIQPELFYARMGVRSYEYVVQSHSGEAYGTGEPLEDELLKIHLLSDNIQLPIMFKYYLPIYSGGFNVQAGPLVSQRFDYKLNTVSQKGYLLAVQQGDGSKWDDGRIRRFAQSMNHVTAGINFGAGYDSASGIGVDFRCYLGLVPVFRNDLLNGKTKDRVWSLSFTYTL